MKLRSVGKIQKLFDGIAVSDGLSEASYNEMVSIVSPTGKKYSGLVLSLKENETGILLLGNFRNVKVGDLVETTGKRLSILAGEYLLGKSVNPLGSPLFNYDDYLPSGEEMPLEVSAPSVIQRQDIYRPLMTGILAIDSLVPIGKGQRQLIIGDRKTGKTSVCIDTIVNQKGKDVICVYVSIAQKANVVARIIEALKIHGADSYTVVVASTSSDQSSLHFIAPYAGTAVAEYFAKKGKDVLVVYDDLSKHAESYREVSLLLGRAAGREAYPGDVFYLHSRLLERSAQLSSDCGGGSITSLPIIETLSGDVSSYIPTNVISITDGQVFLDAEAFNSGQRPAINVGLSVSRVGGAAQTPIMKKISGPLKLELAQFRELEAFAQFGSELDKETAKKLKRGSRMMEILKQDELKLLSLAEQVFLMYTVVKGYLDGVEVAEVLHWKEHFLEFLQNAGKGILDELSGCEKLDDRLEKEVLGLIEKFTKEFEAHYAKR